MTSTTSSVASGSDTLQTSPVPSHVKSPRSWYLHCLASLLAAATASSSSSSSSSFSSSSSPTPPTISPSSTRIHPYWLAHSSFIGPGMVSHLMRHKKPLALGVKFRQSPVAVTTGGGGSSNSSSSRTRHVDAITNMEGALHTFVTPVVRTLIHGDYQYQYGHGISEFGEVEDRDLSKGGSGSGRSRDGGKRFQLAREVLISGLVHLDFEYENVMWEFVRDDDLKALLPSAETDSGANIAKSGTSAALLEPIDETSMISVPEKHDPARRRAYDASLRRQARLYLLQAQGADVGAFVGSAKDPSQHVTLKEAIDLLTSSILACSAPTISNDPISAGANPAATILAAVTNKWLLVAPNSSARLARRFARDKLSLHLLFLTMLHQVRNEHALLDRVVDDIYHASSRPVDGTAGPSRAGYVYTYDPPQIFRTALGDEGKELLTALHAAALRHLLVAGGSSQGHGPGEAFARRMRVFAYNDFGNPGAMDLMRGAFGERLAPSPRAVEEGQVLVMRKAELFATEPGEGASDSGLYRPPEGVKGKGYWLVLHNNSDGFGNNVENEAGMGSLDAVLGEYSGMAAAMRVHDPALLGDGENADDWEVAAAMLMRGDGMRRSSSRKRKRKRKRKLEGGDEQPGREKESRVMALSDESLGLGIDGAA